MTNGRPGFVTITGTTVSPSQHLIILGGNLWDLERGIHPSKTLEMDGGTVQPETMNWVQGTRNTETQKSKENIIQTILMIGLQSLYKTYYS